MFSITHDLLLLGLAGVVLFATMMCNLYVSIYARQLLRRKLRWIRVLNGMLFGGGIWTAHFLALSAYEGSGPKTYSAGPVALSLLIAVLGGWTISALAGRRYTPHMDTRLALALTLTLASLHYAMMAGVNFNGRIVWDLGLAALSLVAGFAFARLSFHCAVKRRFVVGISCLVLSVVSFYAIALLAFEVVPTEAAEGTADGISPLTLAVAVAVGNALLLIYVASAIHFLRSGRNATRDRQRQFGLFAKNITDTAIFLLDEKGRVKTWNAGARRVIGYGEEEAIGLNLGDLQMESERAGGRADEIFAIARSEGRYSGSGWGARKDGSRFWAEISVEPLKDAKGRLEGYSTILRDRTEMERERMEKQRTARQLNVALGNMSQGLLLFDKDEHVRVKNGQAEQILGLPSGAIESGMSFRDFAARIARQSRVISLSEDKIDAFVEGFRQHFTSRKSGQYVTKVSEDRVLSIGYRLLDDGGWVITLQDVTESHLAQEKIGHMARHDLLTDLPNRHSFSEQLSADLERVGASARTGEGDGIVVAIVDLDDFKAVNDSYGHWIGDEYLRALSANISAQLKPDEIIARIGGDEFAARAFVTRPGQAQDFIARLRRGIEREVEVNALTLRPKASIGWALGPRDGDTPSALMKAADLAMYKCKEQAGRYSREYDLELDREARAKRKIMRDLPLAIANGQFELEYQEQRRVMTTETTGYEALIRWRHPELGQVMPSAFIPLAEQTGEIVQVGEWVLRQACRDAAVRPDLKRVAVNISAVQLSQPKLARTVERALRSAGLPAHRLEVEVTETAIFTDRERALESLREIRALGVSIAIDDFGTGYNSLATLSGFPFDRLKIDRTFLANVANSPQARSIYRAMLSLGASLRIPVLAEGVETPAQLAFLAREGCREAQGHHIGRPARLEDIAQGGANSRVA